jgi:peptide/nickel transport system ATP-binding protein
MSDNQHNYENVLEVTDLKMHFPIKKGIMQKTIGHVRAVDGVDITIGKKQTYGLVGESGCGKTTVGRTLLRLIEASSGKSIVCGHDIFAMKREELRVLRPKMQIIFQDPYSSLDPRLPVGEIIGEAVREHGLVPKKELKDYVLEVMDSCELHPYQYERYPHEFSGGQRQRICIARALALNPEFIVADEPVSALDVSVQAQVINLMQELQERRGLSYLFISHDLSVVEHISDFIGVMYLGTIVETAPKTKFFAHPRHPYSLALLSAVPAPDPDVKMNRVILDGDIPSPVNPPAGCKFHTRCKYVQDVCKEKEPLLEEVEAGHYVACHFTDQF